MIKHIVGNIEGNDVIYIEEKDLIFCKKYNCFLLYSKRSI